MNLRTVLVLVAGALAVPPATAQSVDPSPPDRTVRLVFIHHSTGENWLADDNGGLARALQENGYFVSDTNYGWGPGGIGDRTDLVDWPEWFLGPDRDRILAALFGAGEVNSPYERTLADPGGENEVVLFKSCFPNSALEGRPDDPPGDAAELSVAGAKRVYLDLLGFFASRPDKLFVVVTAPPLSDPTHAANARAFNRWLVGEWLEGYAGANVAVWDFYNVLTAPENHHRVEGGRIGHAIGRSKDTLSYASGPDDDHPSMAGNRKATAEFVPVLNVHVRRWLASSPPDRPRPPARPESPERPGSPVPGPGEGPRIDGFEAGDPEGTEGWQAFDERGGASLRIAPDGSVASEGERSLRLDVDVPAGSWATCILFRAEPIDGAARGGLRFRLRADRDGVPFTVLALVGRRGEYATYHAALETTGEAVEGWIEIALDWADFRRVDWEDGAGRPCPGTDLIGVGVGLSAGDEALRATLHLDDVAWARGE